MHVIGEGEMKIGISIIFDENGEVIEERKVIIQDEATTTLCRPRHYDYGWEVK